MKKFTLLLASAVCVVNLGFAQSEQVVELGNDIQKVTTLQKPARPFNFLKASQEVMKAPAQTAALEAPVATEATDVSIYGFTANWEAVEGADAYYVDVARTFTTTTASATMYQLYEDFRMTEPGLSSGTLYLFDEGQTMRDWQLIGGSTGQNLINVSPDGILYTPDLDLSDISAARMVANFAGLENDSIYLGYYWYEEDGFYGGLILAEKFDEQGILGGAWGLNLSSLPGRERCGFYFTTPASNVGDMAVGPFAISQEVPADTEINVYYGSAQTMDTSAKFYTLELDEGSEGVTDLFDYCVAAFTISGGSIGDISDFSNVIVVDGNSVGVEDVVVDNDKIFVSDKLHVVLETPAAIDVYNLAGVQVGSYQGVAGDNEIALPTAGVYVVKAGNTVAKVMK